MQQGIRSIAQDLCTRQLGYRIQRDAAEAERREIAEERLTSLDRRLLRDAQEIDSDLGASHFVVNRNPMQAGSAEMARLRVQHDMARLAVLGRMGLAESTGPNRWRVRRDFDQILRPCREPTTGKGRSRMVAACVGGDGRVGVGECRRKNDECRKGSSCFRILHSAFCIYLSSGPVVEELLEEGHGVFDGPGALPTGPRA